MPVQVLIRATDHAQNGWKKGFPVEARDEPCSWARKEGLPDYVVLRIPNATATQVENFLASWRTDFEYSQSTPSAGVVRLTAGINSQITVKTDFSGLKQTIRDLITDDWGGTLVNWSTAHVTADFPDTIDIPALKADFVDKISEWVDHSVYRFSDADVDTVIAQGGFYEMPRAQVTARIIDRRKP